MRASLARVLHARRQAATSVRHNTHSEGGRGHLPQRRRESRFREGLVHLRSHFVQHWPAVEADRLLSTVDTFLAMQTVDNAARVLESFFSVYSPARAARPSREADEGVPSPPEAGPGGLLDLERILACFADKRVVLNMVNSLLASDDAMARVARQSYPHPIGFDKLVLVDSDRDFKLRLHLYWRTPQELAQELPHAHIFEMASAPVTGELTNHLFSVATLDDGVGSSSWDETVGTALGGMLPMQAYTGYERDAEGVLHKRHMGSAVLVHESTDTVTPGQVYAQPLGKAHYVETNAESGHANLDFCSTVYVHGPKLEAAPIEASVAGQADLVPGRSVPVLFEEEELPLADAVVDTIPPMDLDLLRRSLQEYAYVLSASLDFWDSFIYDSEQRTDRSMGLLSGYLLAEHLGSPAVGLALRNEPDWCKRVLDAASELLHDVLSDVLSDGLLASPDHATATAKLLELVRAGMLRQQAERAWSYQNEGPSTHGATWRVVRDREENRRSELYYEQIIKKALRHPGGPRAWLGRGEGDLFPHLVAYFSDLRGFHGADCDYLKPYWGRVNDMTRRRAEFNHTY